jgi:uncharacterized protein
MRLTSMERSVIKEAVSGIDPNAEVFLFGSRVSRHAKGGDIDLLIISETMGIKDKVNLLLQIKDKLGEQKIDVIIKSKAEIKDDPFVNSIFSTAKSL